MSTPKQVTGKPRTAANTRPPPRPAQSPAIRRAIVRGAFETWVIPATAVVLMCIFWVMSSMEIWPQAVAVVGVAGCLLLLVLFAAFRTYFFAADAHSRNASLGFCALWFAALFASFYHHVFPGAPLASAVLRPGSGSVEIPGPGLRALVVDGRFVGAQGQGNRLGHFRLQASDPAGPSQIVEGDFEDSFARQRLGRRGSTVVEIQHTSQRHLVRVGDHAKFEVTDIDKSLEPELTVTAYTAISPWLLSLFGVFGIVGSLALEKWLDGDGSGLMAVTVTFFVVDQYERWGAPHPQMKSFIGAILVGSFIGAPLAAIAWRVVPRRWVVRGR